LLILNFMLALGTKLTVLRKKKSMKISFEFFPIAFWHILVNCHF
jgi:hypothetical protein